MYLRYISSSLIRLTPVYYPSENISFMSSLLTTFQVEEQLLPSETSWFLLFSPLFICDGLNAYFCIIVFIRQYLDRLKMRREGQRPPNKFPRFGLWSLSGGGL